MKFRFYNTEFGVWYYGSSNDDKSEALRGFSSDRRGFEGIESQVNYIINNENRDIRDVAREIEILYRKEHEKNK